MFTKSDFLIGLAVGAVAGALGYKLFKEHKEQLLSSFDSITARFSKDDENLSDEELQLQKEHLEDLIAEREAAKKTEG